MRVILFFVSFGGLTLFFAFLGLFVKWSLGRCSLFFSSLPTSELEYIHVWRHFVVATYTGACGRLIMLYLHVCGEKTCLAVIKVPYNKKLVTQTTFSSIYRYKTVCYATCTACGHDHIYYVHAAMRRAAKPTGSTNSIMPRFPPSHNESAA